VVAVPNTRIGQNLTIVAFFAVLSISGLLWMAINTGQRIGPLPPQFIITFNVQDADGLVNGSDVRIAGVQVGKVNKVTTLSTGAQVEMGIDPQYNTIYSDATVLIRPKSLLGEKYVDMTRGTSNVRIPDGGSLPDSQAFTQVEVDQVLNNSDEATRKAFSNNIISLGQATKDRGVDVNATIPELRAIAEHLTPVSARFKDRTAQIDHILVDTDIILTTLADEHAQLATLLQSADTVTGTLAANDQHLANILNHGGNVFQEINTAVGQQNNDANIRQSTEQLPPVLGHLNQFLALTSSDLNTLVPSLLLGQQYQYPNDQLTVAIKPGLQNDTEWDSGFRWYDPNAVNGFHGFGAVGLQCGNDTPGVTMDPNHICPGFNKGYGAPAPQALATNGGAALASSTSSTGNQNVSGALQGALLSYLLGQ
jgi:virulence factor Mce-like protein